MIRDKAMRGNIQLKVPVQLEQRIDKKAAELSLRRADFLRMVLSAATTDRMDYRFFERVGATNEQSPAA